MRFSTILLSIYDANKQAGKAVESLTQQSDIAQWVMAGIELGRVEELANRLAETCKLARDILWEESQSR